MSARELPSWTFEPGHTEAGFRARHMMVTWVNGLFKDVHGELHLDFSEPLNATFSGEIDATRLWTGEPDRDAHLRSADFFDVANHPAITFRSKRITAAGADRFKVTGDLTIRGGTREVTFDVEGPTTSIKDPWGNVRTGVSATTKINRKDFGLVWNALTEAGGVVVGDEVSITFEAELVQKAPAGDAK